MNTTGITINCQAAIAAHVGHEQTTPLSSVSSYAGVRKALRQYLRQRCGWASTLVGEEICRARVVRILVATTLLLTATGIVL